jgi:hypothetical protein
VILLDVFDSDGMETSRWVTIHVGLRKVCLPVVLKRR